MKAIEVAKYFICLHKNLIDNIKKNDETSENEAITHLKIQKLLYYAQGLSLVYLSRPLFVESIEAWPHGPVVKDVYNQLREHRKDDLQGVDELKYTEDTLSVDEKSIVKMAFREYGRYTASHLRNKTHDESTWKNAWEKGKNTIIPHNEMLEFFKREQKHKAESLYLKSKEFRCLFS